MRKKSYSKIVKEVHAVAPNVRVEEYRGCIKLTGECDNWRTVYEAGKAARSSNHLGVLNDVKLKGFQPKMLAPTIVDKALDGERPDVLIVGGGIVGCAIARELSKLKLSVLLVEKSYDVATAASSRNDGCVHVGIDLHKGQQKLIYNGWGNSLFDKLCEELDVAFERKGHVLMFYKGWEKRLAVGFLLRAKQNGIKGVCYLPREQLAKHEPNLPDWCSGGMYMPSGGIVSPYKLTIALAENAAANGVKISFDTIVRGMTVEGDKITSVDTNRGIIYPKMVINAAGVYSDIIADMAGDRTFTIHPRKGTNLILDKKVGWYAATSMAKSPFSFVPGINENLNKNFLVNVYNSAVSKSNTKGGGVVHTVDNNVLVGPSAVEVPDREDYSTDKKTIDTIVEKQKLSAQNMTHGDVITYYSGTRAATYEEDFVVRKGIFTENIIQAAGIQSPGITAAPAIAVQIAGWTKEYFSASPNPTFNGVRHAVPHLAEMPLAERNRLIKSNPDYGEIVCRCEEISKGEILDALRSPLKVASVDAIKRRVRPGMGRCQGGFCSPLVAQIIAREYGIPLQDVKKGSESSTILLGDIK